MTIRKGPPRSNSNYFSLDYLTKEEMAKLSKAYTKFIDFPVEITEDIRVLNSGDMKDD